MWNHDLGLIGLAVMGENLVLNMAGRGFRVAVYNRTLARVDEFVRGRGAGGNIKGCRSVEELVASLRRPRKVMAMVKAGQPVDELFEQLVPLLEKGDVLIDGGNSHFQDTRRRACALEKRGLLYVGAGVSGGEAGALLGPSIMPGGSIDAWPIVQPIFQAIAARVDDAPCCNWVGPDGAGHFAKMVHNGIEYGDMQMICEAYWLLSQGLGLSDEELAEVFADWNRGELNSYLVEITSHILRRRDEASGRPILDVVLDVAGQKGTGKWTIEASLDLGVAAPTIASAIFARFVSALKDERVAASRVLAGPAGRHRGNPKHFCNMVRDALYASKICSYAQGFQLIATASARYGWDIDVGSLALIWRGGCIIRAHFLNKLSEAFGSTSGLANLLLAPYFRDEVEKRQEAWRGAVIDAVATGVAVPAFSSALAYFDSYRAQRLPANLLQAQRDYFGAHTYERVDRPRGEFFHTDWGADNPKGPRRKNQIEPRASRHPAGKAG